MLCSELKSFWLPFSLRFYAGRPWSCYNFEESSNWLFFSYTLPPSLNLSEELSNWLFFCCTRPPPLNISEESSILLFFSCTRPPSLHISNCFSFSCTLPPPLSTSKIKFYIRGMNAVENNPDTYFGRIMQSVNRNQNPN